MDNDSVARRHVLIVEDESDFAALLQSIFQNAGYTAATAHNCEDALAQVSKTRPHVITLDMQMPRKCGAIFYRKLKADEKLRNIPVVVVTGVTRDDKDMETLVRSLLESDNLPHPEAYLEKPVDGPSLLRTIEEAMSISNSASC